MSVYLLKPSGMAYVDTKTWLDNSEPSNVAIRRKIAEYGNYCEDVLLPKGYYISVTAYLMAIEAMYEELETRNFIREVHELLMPFPGWN